MRRPVRPSRNNTVASNNAWSRGTDVTNLILLRNNFAAKVIGPYQTSREQQRGLFHADNVGAVECNSDLLGRDDRSDCVRTALQ